MGVRIGPVTNGGVVMPKGTLDFVNATRVRSEFESFKAHYTLVSSWLNNCVRNDDSVQFQISKIIMY